MKNLKTYKAFEAIDIKPELYKYIDNKDIESIKEFVNDYDNFSRLDTRYKSYTPLIYCIVELSSKKNKQIYRKIIKLLLNAGADPDAENNEKIRPLFYAVISRDIKIIKYLIDAGADWSFRYADWVNNGQTFFEMLNDTDKEIIKQEYPEKYDRYIKKQKSNKFKL